MTAGLGKQVPRTLVLACEVLLAWFVLRGTGCANPSGTDDVASPAQGAIDSGIYGHMAAAFGNAPANPPSVDCVKVYDAPGADLIARATCTGISRDFRVRLAPGRYVVEFGGSWQKQNGAMVFVPDRQSIDISEGQWVKIAPPSPPGPVP
jgi:hypothetical protein